MIAHEPNLVGANWRLIVVILIRSFTSLVTEGISVFWDSHFPCLASSHSLTCLPPESLALRSKRRLMGELISSGFYTRNLSLHCDPLAGKWRDRLVPMCKCESVDVWMWVWRLSLGEYTRSRDVWMHAQYTALNKCDICIYLCVGVSVCVTCSLSSLWCQKADVLWLSWWSEDSNGQTFSSGSFVPPSVSKWARRNWIPLFPSHLG